VGDIETEVRANAGRLSIIVVGAVEEEDYIYEQIAIQTRQPDEVLLYVDKIPARGIIDRRKRVAENQRRLKNMVLDYAESNKVDLIWQVEGDVKMPQDTLERLIGDFYGLDDPTFGYVSGVQLGRHGITAVGAWHVGDDYFESVDHKTKGIEEIDGSGLYCLLAPLDVWLKGHCRWDGEPYGPDVIFGQSLQFQGYRLYVDHDIKLGHRVFSKNSGEYIIDFDNQNICNVRFYKQGDDWKYKVQR
jgi:hypothetical protein